MNKNCKCRGPLPQGLLLDEGSQLIRGCSYMTLTFKDIRHQLHVKVNAEFKLFRVGGHNMNGTVNKKIREMKGSVLKSLENERKLLLP